jgi:hypothetical protein
VITIGAANHSLIVHALDNLEAVVSAFGAVQLDTHTHPQEQWALERTITGACAKWKGGFAAVKLQSNPNARNGTIAAAMGGKQTLGGTGALTKKAPPQKRRGRGRLP